MRPDGDAEARGEPSLLSPAAGEHGVADTGKPPSPLSKSTHQRWGDTALCQGCEEEWDGWEAACVTAPPTFSPTVPWSQPP